MPTDTVMCDTHLPVPRLEYQRRRLNRQHRVPLRRTQPPAHNASRGNSSNTTGHFCKAVSRVFRLEQAVAKMRPSAFLHFGDAGLYVRAVEIEVPTKGGGAV